MKATEAISIYQRLLDAVSEAVLRGDHVTVASYMFKPFHMRTVNGWFPLNTLDDFEHGVQSTYLSLKVQGVTDYVRIAKSANVRKDGTIDGVHTTHILRNETQIVPSFQSRMRLKEIDGEWLFTMGKHSIDNYKWPVSLPDVKKGDLASLDQSAEVDDIALECYQDFLDQITAINISGNFDDWIEACEFPHRVQIDRVDRIIETPADIAPFFDTVSGMLEKHPTATFHRAVTYAGFLDSHTLRGYHTATLKTPDGEIFPPVASRMTIRFSDQKWRMIDVVNSIVNSEFPYTVPSVSDHMTSEFHNPKKDIQ